MGLIPDTSRPYPMPSCGACLRIANSHGFVLGSQIPEGRIEAYTHSGGRVHALVVNSNGFVEPLPLAELEMRRSECL